jgi:hypothetical protein
MINDGTYCEACGHPIVGIRHQRATDKAYVHPTGACPVSSRRETLTPEGGGRGLSPVVTYRARECAGSDHLHI